MDMTLVVMAAGLGSRYGGVKQIERLGPDGEILMEYAIYDALCAGLPPEDIRQAEQTMEQMMEDEEE